MYKEVRLDAMRYILTMFAVTLAAIIVAIGIMIVQKAEVEDRISADGYTVYLDGNEVDPNTIDIDQYQYSIDNENHNVYLTRR